MRKACILIVIAGLCATTHAAMLTQGTQEIAVRGAFDTDTGDGSLLDLEVGYGAFLHHNVEVLGRVLFYNSDSRERVGLGGALEYNIDFGTELVPYVGAGLSLAYYDYEDGPDGLAAILDVRGGAKFFIVENVALDGAVVFQAATDDLYTDEDDYEKTNVLFQLGMRFFF